MADGGAKVEEVRREVAGLKAQLSECCRKGKKDLTNLEQELAKLKEEMRATRPKAVPLAPPAANAAVPPAPASSAPAKPAPKPAPVKLSPPPSPPQPKQQFPPSVKQVTMTSLHGYGTITINVPDGTIAHLTRESGGNLNDGHVIDKRDRISESRLCPSDPIGGLDSPIV
jgi:hypothetical protein